MTRTHLEFRHAKKKKKKNSDMLVKRLLGWMVVGKTHKVSTWSWISLRTFTFKSYFPFGAQTLQGVQVFPKRQ